MYGKNKIKHFSLQCYKNKIKKSTAVISYISIGLCDPGFDYANGKTIVLTYKEYTKIHLITD